MQQPIQLTLCNLKPLFQRKVAAPNRVIKSRRDFKNPCLYERLVAMFGIDEKSTNFPPSVFDPDDYMQTDLVQPGENSNSCEKEEEKEAEPIINKQE
jgi:hypothetical protein